VLTSLGLPRVWALGSLRVTLGVGTTIADVDAFSKTLPPLVEKTRGVNHR